jgi:signal transduction histidine kinase
LSLNNVSIIFEDSKGTIWFGTQGGGLNKYNEKTDDFTIINEKNGLACNYIAGILEAKNGDLWISSNKGIFKFNPLTRKTKTFDLADGLQGNEFNPSSSLKANDGRFYFGGINGINAFFPDHIKENPFIPPVYITSLSIFNKLITFNSPDSILKQSILETTEITLPHYKSVISFEFAALDYIEPVKNQYAYRLENFESEWNYVGNKRNATYTNLDPGEYFFHVKASNNDGIWNETGTTLKIVITPPWWKTTFAIVSFALLIIGLLLGFYFYRINQLNRQKVLLEKLVMDRTNELKEKNEILFNQSNQLSETNTLLEERQKFIQEQTEELRAHNDILNKQAIQLSETNTLLEERQQFIEEQSEELRAHNEILNKQAIQLADTNALLEERQQQIEEQAEELLASNDKLSTVNATKDKFFSIIAHDLKSPLKSSLGFCGLILSRYKQMDDNKRINLIGIVHESSKNLFKLLDNLLQWARSQTGDINFQPVEIDLNELIEVNTILVENLILEKNLEMKNNLSGELKIFADRNMIDTVIRNLITTLLSLQKTEVLVLKHFRIKIKQKLVLLIQELA